MLNHFNFKFIARDTALVTNDFGYYAFLTASELKQLVTGRISNQSELYDTLHDKLFLLHPMDLYSPTVTDRLRSIKRYTFIPTSLHIFVVTNTCNLRCVYCQANAYDSAKSKFMSEETARRAVETALQSPANNLTFEFQGGEPLLNFAVIKEIVRCAEASETNKHIQFSLVSNLSLLSDEMLDFLIEHNVSISTSLDGPSELHNLNRPTGKTSSSYALLAESIGRIRAKGYNVGGIQTTTRSSLTYPREIVREYAQMGLVGIFIRPLTPLGVAKTRWNEIGYTPEHFVDFYREVLHEVIEINKTGKFFPEQHAAIYLRKIFYGDSPNYMDLRSPCGAGIGQLAYYLDGNVYTCDEARMVAEMGDQAFLLGNVYSNSYEEMVSCDICKATCISSVTESVPSCCDCVYQPYCGVCPVVNYTSEGSIFPRTPRGYRCRINSGILGVLFDLLLKADQTTLRILRSWVNAEPLQQD